jgi:hemoglobin
VNDEAIITEEQLERLIPHFYGAVRADPMLGPVFNDAIGNWPDHLQKLVAFWSSVMLTTGRYKGNPMAAHLKHGARLTPEMFDRWLTLWARASAEIVPPAVARALQAKAERIAESLSLALFFRLDPAARPGNRAA